eukprot:3008952-Rhodomonas_salina.1
MAADLKRSWEILRVPLMTWDVGEREKPAGGNGWAAMVTDHKSTETRSRMRLVFFDQEAVARVCEECGDQSWEKNSECACDAP